MLIALLLLVAVIMGQISTVAVMILSYKTVQFKKTKKASKRCLHSAIM